VGSDNRRVPAEATLPHRATPVVGPHRYAEVEVGERSGNAKRSDPIGQAGAPSWPAPFRAERVPGRPSGLRPEATTEAVFIPTRACRNGLRSAGSLPARRRVGPRRRGHAPGRGSSRTREDLGSSRGVFDPLPGRPKVVPEGIRPPPVKTQGHPGGYSTPSREDPRSSRRGFDPPQGRPKVIPEGVRPPPLDRRSIVPARLHVEPPKSCILYLHVETVEVSLHVDPPKSRLFRLHVETPSTWLHMEPLSPDFCDSTRKVAAADAELARRARRWHAEARVTITPG